MVSLSDFDMIKVIGRGSYAKVLMVELKTTRRIYAMKVIKKELQQAQPASSSAVICPITREPPKKRARSGSSARNSSASARSISRISSHPSSSAAAKNAFAGSRDPDCRAYALDANDGDYSSAGADDRSVPLATAWELEVCTERTHCRMVRS